MILGRVVVGVKPLRLSEVWGVAVYQRFSRKLRDVFGQEAFSVPIPNSYGTLAGGNRFNAPNQVIPGKPGVDLPWAGLIQSAYNPSAEAPSAVTPVQVEHAQSNVKPAYQT